MCESDKGPPIDKEQFKFELVFFAIMFVVSVLVWGWAFN